MWIGDNRARIRHSVPGLCRHRAGKAYEKMSRMKIEKVFGLPGGVF